MMQATQKRALSLVEARSIADTLQSKLKPYCKPGKCTAAGSVRRERPDVGDIELVCLPRFGPVKKNGELFPVSRNLVIHYLQKQYRQYHGIQPVKGGPRYHQFLYGSTQIDLFMPLESQWGRILALRTGPAELSKKMALRWVQLGYEGVDGELLEHPFNGLYSKSIPEFPTEQSFFDFLGWEYTEPKYR
jgi:DNA polymerase/3'-5' exonuclease PolX